MRTLAFVDVCSAGPPRPPELQPRPHPQRAALASAPLYLIQVFNLESQPFYFDRIAKGDRMLRLPPTPRAHCCPPPSFDLKSQP